MWWILGSQQSAELLQVRGITLYWEKPKCVCVWGGGTCENASCAEQHSSGIPDGLDGQSRTSYLQKEIILEGGKPAKEVSG